MPRDLELQSRILHLVYERPRTFTELMAVLGFGALEFRLLDAELRRLRKAGLIESRRGGRWPVWAQKEGGTT